MKTIVRNLEELIQRAENPNMPESVYWLPTLVVAVGTYGNPVVQMNGHMTPIPDLSKLTQFEIGEIVVVINENSQPHYELREVLTKLKQPFGQTVQGLQKTKLSMMILAMSAPEERYAYYPGDSRPSTPDEISWDMAPYEQLEKDWNNDFVGLN